MTERGSVRKIFHFLKDEDVYEITYEITPNHWGLYSNFFKVPGSDKKCDCGEKEYWKKLLGRRKKW